MSMSKAVLLGFGVSAGAILLAHAAGPKFNIKPGLWEITSTGTSSGTPPIPDDVLARMSPDQRAKFEASMQAAMAQANAPHVVKSCITEKQLEQGPDFGGGDSKSCKQTIVTQTSTAMEVHMECSGEQKMSGTLRYQAVSSEAVSGSTDMVVTNGTKTMSSKHNMQGKWLGSDCGSVKPSGEN